MSPADLARRLFRDQCRHNDLSAYGETAAVAAMVPLIEALEQARTYVAHAFEGVVAAPQALDAIDDIARASLTTQPEEVA